MDSDTIKPFSCLRVPDDDRLVECPFRAVGGLGTHSEVDQAEDAVGEVQCVERTVQTLVMTHRVMPLGYALRSCLTVETLSDDALHGQKGNGVDCNGESA